MTAAQLRLAAPLGIQLPSFTARLRFLVSTRDREAERRGRETAARVACYARLAGAGARAERARIASRLATP
jgi:hypothetical protein